MEAPVLLALLFACATVNPSLLPTHDLLADDGGEIAPGGPVQLAIVGDMRPTIGADAAKGRVNTPYTEARIVGDISTYVQRGDVDGVVLLGDLVPYSSTRTWKHFAQDWSSLLSGSEFPQPGVLRTRTLPVAGNHDRIGDGRLVGFGASFPGVGQEIGFGRVASWQASDVVTKKRRWRLLLLDSDKSALGTRWEEQLRWLDGALEGEYDGVLVFMHHPRYTLARGQTADWNKAPSELLQHVEDGTKLGMIKAVFAGHAHTTEVFLPSGPLGEIYVTAGGGGSPADSLPRRGVVEGKDLALAPSYDLALQKAVDRWSEAGKLPQALVDKAQGSGAWQDFIGEYDVKGMPVQGWMQLELDGPDLALTFRMIGPDGALADAWAATWDPKSGWMTGR